MTAKTHVWVIAILLTPIAMVIASLFMLVNGANDGALDGNARVYVAEDETLLAILTEALGQDDYLTPRAFDIAVSHSRGHILKLDAGTRVHRLGAHFLKDQQFLRMRVEDGPSRGRTVLVPQQFRKEITFYGRSAYP